MAHKLRKLSENKYFGISCALTAYTDVFKPFQIDVLSDCHILHTLHRWHFVQFVKYSQDISDTNILMSFYTKIFIHQWTERTCKASRFIIHRIFLLSVHKTSKGREVWEASIF